MRIFSILVFLLFSLNSNAQNEAIKNTINNFFQGLQNGDTITLKKTIHSGLTLQTISTNKEGEIILKSETKSKFLKGVSTKNSEDIWEEKLLSFTINVDGNLASVWTPYEFYFNEKFSHCGANSFQLYRNRGRWEIISIVDTRRRDNCKSKSAN